MKTENKIRFDSRDFFRGSVSEPQLISAGEQSRDDYGHRYGSEVLMLSAEHLEALLNGKQLAVEIMDGEYVLFIETEGAQPSDKSQSNDFFKGIMSGLEAVLRYKCGIADEGTVIHERILPQSDAKND